MVGLTVLYPRAELILDPLEVAVGNLDVVTSFDDLDQLSVGASQTLFCLQPIDFELDEDRFEEAGSMHEREGKVLGGPCVIPNLTSWG
jgi:hypothetical protein